MRDLSSFLLSAVLFLAGVAVQADPVRSPVQGTPRIFGREMERFVLLKPIDIDRASPGMRKIDEYDRIRVRVLPGQFLAVSEDGAGVYYQARNGLQEIHAHTASAGGLMVSKKEEGAIFVYRGDARELGEPLFRDFYKLSRLELANLKVGRAGR